MLFDYRRLQYLNIYFYLEVELVVWDELEKSRSLLMACNGRVRTAGINALDHLQKARRIAETDPQMACFRAICAEEEAATSLLTSLKEQGYIHSEKYHVKSHDNKAGVAVFIKAVVSWFNDSFAFDELFIDSPILVTTDEPGRPAVELEFLIKGTNNVLRPRPPLNIETNGSATMKELIGKYLRENVKKKLAAEVKAVIKSRANERNLLLYASDEGLPGCFADVNQYLLNQAAIVHAIITSIGLIDPWRKPAYKHASLVEAVVEEYVEIMKSGRG